MRLSEMGPGRDDAPLPAEVEAELFAALEAALAGDDVPAGMEGLEALVSDLRAERSNPESEFRRRTRPLGGRRFPRGRRPKAQRTRDPKRTPAGAFASFFSR